MLSSKSAIIAGTLFNPAIWLALYLLSPAIISYLSLDNFLKTNGCIIPCSFIDDAKSFKAFSSKVSLGWNLFGIIFSTFIYFLYYTYTLM